MMCSFALLVALLRKSLDFTEILFNISIKRVNMFFNFGHQITIITFFIFFVRVNFSRKTMQGTNAKTCSTCTFQEYNWVTML
mmetsp:Transcript_17783/g.26098  ORF Transcript_17783/g.26098 Transcript_17783/m.26098 type:complete len:82 (+) Transcript_17783:45-290(+)